MLRLRAVRELLVDEVAGLRVARTPAGEAGSTAEPTADESPDAAADRDLDALATARRKAVLVAVLDGLAILVLFALRDRRTAFLFLGPAEESAFTLGVLLVAVHLGFRLAQLLAYRNVARIYQELLEREE